MEFTTLSEQVENLIHHLKKREKFSYSDLKIVVSPYRISPLGAHIDHQGGPVLGMAINARSVLACIPNNERKIRLYSTNYPGIVEFSIDHIKTPRKDDWGRYAMGAVKVLGEKKPLELGLTGVVTGTLPASGLSSSASIGLAYLKALEYLNNHYLALQDLVEMDSQIENEYLKLQNGILDQSSIVYGKENSMIYIDTLTGEVKQHTEPDSSKGFRILVIYSGLSRELTASGFNKRVEACKQTAAVLGLMGGFKPPKMLSDIPEDFYFSQHKRIPEELKPWAAHYFTEVRRVKEGIRAWDEGDIEKFGSLMNESSLSTLKNYATESEEIKCLFEITKMQKGVYGAAINGGGYGGCVVAFVHNDFPENSPTYILEKYIVKYPELQGKAKAYFAEPDEGLRIL